MLGTQNSSPGSRLEWPGVTAPISAGVSKKASPSLRDTCVPFLSNLLIPSPCRLLLIRQSFSIFGAPMNCNGWVGRMWSLVGVLRICPPASHSSSKRGLTFTHRKGCLKDRRSWYQVQVSNGTSRPLLSRKWDGRNTQFNSVQSLSRVRLFVTPWTAARQASLSNTNSRSLPKLMSIESVMPSSHLILFHPLLLPSIFPSIRVFSKESALHIRWPKDWSFSFSISPSNEHTGLISFRMDWLDLFAVQGTLKSLLQHHSAKASILQHSAFFLVQLSHPYMTTGKTIVLTRWTFVDKVMSLLLNMQSRLIITLLPRSKRLLISWLQSPSAVILEFSVTR